MKITSCCKVRLNAQGYEYGRYGSYYGVGQPLYRANVEFSNGEESIFEVRANDRVEALANVREEAKRDIRSYN